MLKPKIRQPRFARNLAELTKLTATPGWRIFAYNPKPGRPPTTIVQVARTIPPTIWKQLSDFLWRVHDINPKLVYDIDIYPGWLGVVEATIYNLLPWPLKEVTIASIEDGIVWAHEGINPSGEVLLAAYEKELKC